VTVAECQRFVRTDKAVLAHHCAVVVETNGLQRRKSRADDTGFRVLLNPFPFEIPRAVLSRTAVRHSNQKRKEERTGCGTFDDRYPAVGIHLARKKVANPSNVTKKHSQKMTTE
jgi:hypothetical protein